MTVDPSFDSDYYPAIYLEETSKHEITPLSETIYVSLSRKWIREVSYTTWSFIL